VTTPVLPENDDELHQRLIQAERVIASLDQGVAILDIHLQITWANAPFRQWCVNEPVGDDFQHALESVEVIYPDTLSFAETLAGRTISAKLSLRGKHFLQMTIKPLREDGVVRGAIILCDDITHTVVRQQKLDALHRAGQELGDLDPSQLIEMDVPSRIELLKQNLRRHIHDQLRYNVIEIRLLDPDTGELKPLLQEGMTVEAASRTLHAKTSGNGVTGYVAATATSYLCSDTALDSLFLEGSLNARSSLTVPISYNDDVIGTFNVESPRPNAFGAEDLQFSELFSRELARALHTLNLLSAQQSCSIVQSVDAINRAIAIPADELLAAATTLLTRTDEDESESRELLIRLIGDIRTIRERIQKVGQELSPGVAADSATARLSGLRVLVIDSDENVRRSAHTLLEKHGCLVETASTGQAGIAMARTGKYDGVLSAISHPDMRGYEVYSTVRTLQPQSRVILTMGFGYDSSHTLVKARQDGFCQAIYKPFRIDQVLNSLIGPMPPQTV